MFDPLLRTAASGFAALFLLLYSFSNAYGQQATSTPQKEPPKPGLTCPAKELTTASPGKIKVTFDETEPGVVFVEAGGERLRIDTARKAVERSDASADKGDQVPAKVDPDADQVPANADPQDEDEEESAYDFDAGDEPYDYRLINVPTPKKVPKGTWNTTFTHRFTQPLHPISSSARNLFGLDSFGVASFGVTYGITDKLSISAYRSPLCQRGLCRTVEIGLSYSFFEHDKDSRFALSAYVSAEGNGNFTEEYTYNLQARASIRASKRIYLFFSPAVHINANGQGRFNPRANDFFPPAVVANSFRLPAHGASFGFGTSILITPQVVALFEFTPRTGFKLGTVRPILGPGFVVTGFRNDSDPEMAFGIQRNIGKHSFALTFSNTQTTTTSRYNSSNQNLSPFRPVIGFNLSRRF